MDGSAQAQEPAVPINQRIAEEEILEHRKDEERTERKSRLPQPFALRLCERVLLERSDRETEAIVRFESRLVQYLQTITGYIDTRDRSVGGSELRERLALTEQRLLALKREFESPTPAGARDVNPAKAGSHTDSGHHAASSQAEERPADPARAAGRAALVGC